MAAKAALSRADQESSSGSGNATARRLLEQKDQVVQDLVAAVAKVRSTGKQCPTSPTNPTNPTQALAS